MTIRLNKVTRDLNVGITTVVEFLQKKGYTIEASPNAKITEEQYAVLVKEFSTLFFGNFRIRAGLNGITLLLQEFNYRRYYYI